MDNPGNNIDLGSIFQGYAQRFNAMKNENDTLRRRAVDQDRIMAGVVARITKLEKQLANARKVSEDFQKTLDRANEHKIASDASLASCKELVAEMVTFFNN